jgi:FkbM family methyltransferase
MEAVSIRINEHEPLYVDLRRLDGHASKLFISEPLESVPHEPMLTKLFQDTIGSDDVVFDVGANLGLHTLTFSKLAKQVVAFEPNPALIPNLRRTLKPIQNAMLLDVCLSATDAVIPFHISDWDHMLGSLANWTGQPTTTLQIQGRALDSLLNEQKIPRPSVLKVDVEGAELMVFKGAEQLFNGPNAPRVVIFEELNNASRKLGIEDGAAAEFLRAKGYTLFLITDEGITDFPTVRPPAANLLALRVKG